MAGLAGAGIVLLLVLLALAQRDGDDATSTPGPAASTTPGTTSETEPTTPTTEPPPTTAPSPQTIDELIALLAADPDAHGEKGEDLLEKLQEIQEKPGEQGKKAAELIGEVDQWVADGELNRDTGSLANQLLDPLAQSQPPGRERKGEEEED